MHGAILILPLAAGVTSAARGYFIICHRNYRHFMTAFFGSFDKCRSQRGGISLPAHTSDQYDYFAHPDDFLFRSNNKIGMKNRLFLLPENIPDALFDVHQCPL
jgi:hypothetical protein